MQRKTHYANDRPVFQQEGDTLTWFLKTGLKKAEGHFIDGVMRGEWRCWRESGELWQVGFFRDGVKHNEWLCHTRDGSVKKHERFAHGKALKGGCLVTPNLPPSAPYRPVRTTREERS